MIDGLLQRVTPYMLNGIAYAKVLAPVFVLISIIVTLLNMWLKNDKLDLTKGIIVPLLLAACIFFYYPLIKSYMIFNDVLFGSLPYSELEFEDIWKAYKEGFDTSGMGKVRKIFTIITKGLSAMSVFGTWIAVQLISFVKAFIGYIQFFFKLAVMLSGPWAFLFAMVPPWRKIAAEWFKYLVYFSVWSLSIWIVDALAMGLLESLLAGDMGNVDTGAGAGVAGSQISSSMKAMGSMTKMSTAAGSMFAGVFLYPLLTLFLYFLVPSITRFFYMTTGMENILSAGTAVMTSAFNKIVKSTTAVTTGGMSTVAKGAKSIFRKRAVGTGTTS